MPLWFSMASTSVVLPWSTCAMMAMLRTVEFCFGFPGNRQQIARSDEAGVVERGAGGCAMGIVHGDDLIRMK
jgi:hypothetical protein